MVVYFLNVISFDAFSVFVRESAHIKKFYRIDRVKKLMKEFPAQIKNTQIYAINWYFIIF